MVKRWKLKKEIYRTKLYDGNGTFRNNKRKFPQKFDGENKDKSSIESKINKSFLEQDMETEKLNKITEWINNLKTT